MKTWTKPSSSAPSSAIWFCNKKKIRTNILLKMSHGSNLQFVQLFTLSVVKYIYCKCQQCLTAAASSRVGFSWLWLQRPYTTHPPSKTTHPPTIWRSFLDPPPTILSDSPTHWHVSQGKPGSHCQRIRPLPEDETAAAPVQGRGCSWLLSLHHWSSTDDPKCQNQGDTWSLLLVKNGHTAQALPTPFITSTHPLIWMSLVSSEPTSHICQTSVNNSLQVCCSVSYVTFVCWCKIVTFLLCERPIMTTIVTWQSFASVNKNC